MDYFRGGGMQEEAPVKSGGAAQPAGGMDADGEEYSGFGMSSSVVTPLDECLNQLPPDEAAEIRASYFQPYGECRARLADKASEKRHKQVTRDKEAAIPETPRNYLRVQKPEGAAEEEPEEKPQDGDFLGIKPDKSKASYNR